MQTVDRLHDFLTTRAIQPGGAKPSGEVVPVVLEFETGGRDYGRRTRCCASNSGRSSREARRWSGAGCVSLVGGKSIETEDNSKRGWGRGRR